MAGVVGHLRDSLSVRLVYNAQGTVHCMSRNVLALRAAYGGPKALAFATAELRACLVLTLASSLCKQSKTSAFYHPCIYDTYIHASHTKASFFRFGRLRSRCFEPFRAGSRQNGVSIIGGQYPAPMSHANTPLFVKEGSSAGVGINGGGEFH